MSKRPFRSRVKSTAYIILSFILSIMLFALSFCVVFEVTLFNPDFILDNMNSSNYFNDKCDEITVSLTDLGYASGLSEDFFEGIVDEVMLSEDTRNYVENYYDGNGTKIDATEFSQRFNAALDEYIEKNDIKNVNNVSREKLVNKAISIYKRSVEIPNFNTFSAYILGGKAAMPIVIIVLAICSVIIFLVFIFSNKWKHRAIKYICYATSGAFLSVGFIPAFLLISGKLKQINLGSRAVYNLFVKCSSDICIALLFCALIFLLISLALYFKYRSMHKKT